MASTTHPVPTAPKAPGQVTARDLERFPHYYLQGEGRDAAEASVCRHGVRLTNSCPLCD
ncbi:MAG TPA: hypothetical protein VFY14_07315 [Streptomyces sp.]|nr:hypothetical protein [Streptomyces sp.]